MQITKNNIVKNYTFLYIKNNKIIYVYIHTLLLGKDTMANVNNTSSYMDEDKKKIIKESNFTYRDALEVGAYLIETGKFKRVYKEMQIYDLQKELEAMDD